MASQHGRLREFHPETDTIKSYLERASLYLTANEVPDPKQVAVLLSSIGAPTYALLSDLLEPAKPSSKSYAEISAVLIAHYEPQRLIIAERYHFHKRDQAIGESLADFDAALRKLATHCEFGATLEDTLRDRFVCGLRHEPIQRRLLSEKDLTYAKAMEVARAMEAANTNAKSFKTAEPAIRLFSSQPQQRDSRNPCYRCGRTSHSPSDCKFKEVTCNHCGKKGHIAPVCRSKAKSQQPAPAPPTPSRMTPSGRESKTGRTKYKRQQRRTRKQAAVKSTGCTK